jgi:ABC-type transport system involved in multi-copper enzyme maturation permease subunit
MDFSKLFDIVTPLMILSFMGVIMIGYGFVNPQQQNNVLQFIFGIPIALGAAGFHFLIRRAANGNTKNIWIAEAIIVGALILLFRMS